jgi:hypothetical protein
MTPSCCPCGCVAPQRLIAGIVEPQETAAARQQLGKHLFAATNTHVTIYVRTVGRCVYMRFVSYEIPSV